MKYYYSDEFSDNGVMTLEEAKETLKEDDLKEIELEEMKRDIGGEMYCSVKDLFVKKWDCGRLCNIYNPCNGKNGRCRHLENGFIESGREFLLTKFGLKELTNAKR